MTTAEPPKPTGWCNSCGKAMDDHNWFYPSVDNKPRVARKNPECPR